MHKPIVWRRIANPQSQEYRGIPIVNLHMTIPDAPNRSFVGPGITRCLRSVPFCAREFTGDALDAGDAGRGAVSKRDWTKPDNFICWAPKLPWFGNVSCEPNTAAEEREMNAKCLTEARAQHTDSRFQKGGVPRTQRHPTRYHRQCGVHFLDSALAPVWLLPSCLHF